MKNHVIAAVLAALLLGGVGLLILPSTPVAGDSPEESTNNTVTTAFKVEGMTCGGCEAGVRLNVKKLDGVTEVRVSYEEGRATVTYDATKLTPKQIEAAIEEMGYEAELQEAEPAEDHSGRQ